MTPTEAFLARIQARARSMEPNLRKSLLDGFTALRAILDDAELARLIQSASVERLLSETLTDKAIREAFRSFHAEVLDAVRKATLAHMRELPKKYAPPAVAWDYLNPRVIDAVARLDGQMMQTLAADVRETVRTVVRQGLEAGQNPRVVAATLRKSIGLPAHLADAPARFRAELEALDPAALRRSLVKGWMRLPERPVVGGGALEEGGKRLGSPYIPNRGHAGGKGLAREQFDMLKGKIESGTALTPKQIDAMVKAYEDRMISWNAETVARTCALQSQRIGQRLSWQDAAQRGIVDTGRLVRTWHTVLDGREREEHHAMNGETAPFDGTYSNGDSYPGEGSPWNCRCGETVRTVPASEAFAA